MTSIELITPYNIPEVLALKGVPQPAAHHPEVDTFVHVCMAWEQAKKLAPDDPGIWLAVLLHDLGKALTPADKLPSHPGHEDLGVALVGEVIRRLFTGPPTNEYYDTRNLCVDVCRYHTHCHQVDKMSAKGVRRFLKAINADGYPENFRRFLIACEADARGRLGLEDRDYFQPETLRQWLVIINREDRRDVVARSIREGVSCAIGRQPELILPSEWHDIRRAQNELIDIIAHANERIRQANLSSDEV